MSSAPVDRERYWRDIIAVGTVDLGLSMPELMRLTLRQLFDRLQRLERLREAQEWLPDFMLGQLTSVVVNLMGAKPPRSAADFMWCEQRKKALAPKPKAKRATKKQKRLAAENLRQQLDMLQG